MARFRVVPVMDIKGGVVVHAVRGERSQYRPITSILTETPEPLTLAEKFTKRFGFKEMYIADLDAIAGEGSNLKLFRSISESTGLSLMVDAGVHKVQEALSLVEVGVSKVIVGSETLESMDEVSQVLSAVGAERLTISVDTFKGRLISRSPSVSRISARSFAGAVERLGVCELVLLSLSRVGAKEGVDIPLLKEVMGGTKIPILMAGGVAGMGDLLALRRAGAAGVLLATALHNGAITEKMLEEFTTSS